jgi:NCS1 family nucleobase:cation symporter-1
VPSLFNPAAGSLYYYTKGWNLKALGSWVAAAVFGIPGLVGAYHPSWVGHAAGDIYKMGWFICFAASMAFYFAANHILPAQVVPEGYTTDPKEFESFASTDGYLGGDPVIEFRDYEVQVGEEPAGSGASAHSGDIAAEKV